MGPARREDPLLEDVVAEGVVGRLDRDNFTGLDALADRGAQSAHFLRSPVCRHDDLHRRFHQHFESFAEFFVALFAVQELQIIDQKQIDGLHGLAQNRIGRCAQGRYQMVHEELGRQDRPPGVRPFRLRSGRSLKQVRFADAGGGVDVEQAKRAIVTGRHLAHRCTGEAIGRSFGKGVEGQFRVQRGAVQEISRSIFTRVRQARDGRGRVDRAELRVLWQMGRPGR
jgi:hypothetical protein